MSKQKYKYHYFYKITNNLNNHFYYGIHNTNDLNDGYMGSGTRLHYAYKKYGIENFTKEILKYFNTFKEAAEYEAEIVTEDLVKDINCYNISLGGDYGWKCTKNTVSVKDKDGNTFRVYINDSRYLSGELVGVNKGLTLVEDNLGNRFLLEKNDDSIKKYHHPNLNKYHFKDNKGNIFFVSKDDERVLSGKLLPIKKIISEETKKKLKENWYNIDHSKKTCWVCNKNETIKIFKTDIDNYLNNGYQHGKIYHEIKNINLSNHFKEIKHQQGEKNSQYGTCWIYNDKECIKIKKEQLEEYISKGWIKGRKMKF